MLGFFSCSFVSLGLDEGKKLDEAGRLRRHRDKFAVDEEHLIHITLGVLMNKLLRNGAGQGEIQAAHAVDVGRHHLHVGIAAKRIATLAADAGHANLEAFLDFGSCKLGGPVDDGGVETATQATVGGHDDDGAVLFLRMLHEERMRRSFNLAGQFGQHILVFFRIRTESFDSRLSAAQLGRCDHIHGLGDLLRLADACDLQLNIFQ